MKVKDLILKLQALNPEGEVWCYSGGWDSEPSEVTAIWAAEKDKYGEASPIFAGTPRKPLPASAFDTVIMLDNG